jgi:hypothetical protein
MSKGRKLRKIYIYTCGKEEEEEELRLGLMEGIFFNVGVQMLEEISFCLKKHAMEALCILRVHEFLKYKFMLFIMVLDWRCKGVVFFM